VEEHFVGRGDELAVLDAAMAAVRAGQPQVVLVEGAAGAGKSSLLSRFAAAQPDARVLRASGDEAEMLLPWGVTDQLLAGAAALTAPALAGSPAAPPARSPAAAPGRPADADPLVVGARLVAALGDLQDGDRPVVILVDDLHWSDLPSAQALLFALRRMQADRVLGLVSTRPGELGRLGEGWGRFTAGDHRATRLRLGGLGAGDLVALARALGVGELPSRRAAQLLAHTDGNALYCRALLEELGRGGLATAGPDLPAPRALSGMIAARLQAVSEPARRLVTAAAVLGRRGALADAAGLAGLADPLAALDEAVAAGLLAEDPAGLAFAHQLVRAAVRDSIGPAERRRLHAAAAGLVTGPAALTHRIAAAVGPDDRLARDLEAAARAAARQGMTAQAAQWRVQASAASTGRPDQERLLLDAVAGLLDTADLAGAMDLWPAVARFGPSARRSALLGHLDLLDGRGAVVEAHLLEAWRAHDPGDEPLVGASAATLLAHYLGTRHRAEEAVTWGERAVSASAGDAVAGFQATTVVALSLTIAGRGAAGLARLALLPATAAAVPAELTDGLIARGMCRLITDDAAGAVADLSEGVARLRAGVSVRFPGYCMAFLAEAEYRLGAWDDALQHAELAVSLARDTDRTWALAFAHAYAAAIPAARGDWPLAAAHVAGAQAAAAGAGTAIRAAAWAGATLATARGDQRAVLSAVGAVRALGQAEAYGMPGWADWRPLEVEALIGLGQLAEAAAALAELDAAVPAAGQGSGGMTAARLRGNLAVARDDLAAAAESFGAAFAIAGGLAAPFQMALLERDDGRRLRRAGERRSAVARLRQARDRFAGLGAQPYVAACEQDLEACGAQVQPGSGPARWNLTAAETAVARLVAGGRSNREVAAELFVSVKAVEFHLGHVFDKLGIRSRRALPALLAGSGAGPEHRGAAPP
jgi:DNA-binding CsgD family transcriptional regulator